MVYLDKNNPEEAIKFYKKIININNPAISADAYNHLGNLYRRQGKINESIQEFKKSCELGRSDVCIWLRSNY